MCNLTLTKQKYQTEYPIVPRLPDNSKYKEELDQLLTMMYKDGINATISDRQYIEVLRPLYVWFSKLKVIKPELLHSTLIEAYIYKKKLTLRLVMVQNFKEIAIPAQIKKLLISSRYTQCNCKLRLQNPDSLIVNEDTHTEIVLLLINGYIDIEPLVLIKLIDIVLKTIKQFSQELRQSKKDMIGDSIQTRKMKDETRLQLNKLWRDSYMRWVVTLTMTYICNNSSQFINYNSTYLQEQKEILDISLDSDIYEATYNTLVLADKNIRNELLNVKVILQNI